MIRGVVNARREAIVPLEVWGPGGNEQDDGCLLSSALSSEYLRGIGQDAVVSASSSF